MKKLIAVILAAVMLAAVAAGSGVVALTDPTADWEQTGDVNGDGEVNNKDVVTLFRFVSSAHSAEDEAVYDFNIDGFADNKDVVALFRAVSVLDGVESGYNGYISALKDGMYERGDDTAVYNASLSKFNQLRLAASAENDPEKRFVLYAQAEAELLDSAVMIPTTSQGGSYTLSRIAPHTTPYAAWGNDSYHLKGLVISDQFISTSEREALNGQWDAARLGEGNYDPAAYLVSKGHTLKTTYADTYTVYPITLDWLATSSSRESLILANTVDGLVEYDNFGMLKPALAESWEISDDGLTYTFHIRTGAAWYTSSGSKYADVTAYDFEAGFQHMLDSRSGLEWLVEGVVDGVSEYIYLNGSWDGVGYKATDAHTLVVTLERPAAYFRTMLCYSCFLPICKSFYESKGGVYGMVELEEAIENGSCTYGDVDDVDSQVYCGAFLLKKVDLENEIILEKNENYYDKDSVTLDSIVFIRYLMSIYERYGETVSGTFDSISLAAASGTLDLAVEDGNFDKYAYVSETDSITYFTALNLNRGAFELDSGLMASSKTEEEKADAATALNNRNFRQALAFAFNKSAWNATQTGEALADASLRNIFTYPDLVCLSKDVTVGGHTFAAGTFYGEIVQYYLNKMGSPIIVADGQDGWFNPAAAQSALQKAKKDLGDNVSWPVQIDLPYPENDTQRAKALAFKESIENVLGADNVVINLIGGSISDYLSSTYYVANGSMYNYDVCYGSGWGPDYGDPSTYLDSLAPDGAGFVTSLLGLF